MKNVMLLVRVQLSALLGFNRILHLPDKKERVRKLLGRVGIILCVLMVLPSFGMYAWMIATGMNAMGQLGLFPAVVLGMSCAFTLFSSISLAQGTLFAFKDYDMVMSLPVSHTQVAASRLAISYVVTLGVDLLIAIPCGAVYAYMARPPLGFYPMYLLTMLASPVLPMIVGAAVGALVARLTARLPGAKYLQMLLAVAVSMGIMTLSWKMGDMSDEMEMLVFGDFGAALVSLMNRVYPLTGIYVSAVRDLSWLHGALFVLIAAAAMVGASLLMGCLLPRLNAALTASRAKGNWRMGRLNTASPTRALYRKEIKRYLGSPVYLFNTAFGPLMALLGVGYLMFTGRAEFAPLLKELELVGLDDRFVAYAIGYLAAFLLCVSCTTSCSISMEGKSLWLIQSLPVSGARVLFSKLLVNWTITVPAALIIALGAGWRLELGAVNGLRILAMGLAYALLDACVGLMINLKTHNFEWTTEAMVVKQSAAAGITIFLGMALVIVPGVLTFVWMDWSEMIYWATVGVMTLAGLAMLCLFRARGDKWVRAL